MRRQVTPEQPFYTIDYEGDIYVYLIACWPHDGGFADPTSENYLPNLGWNGISSTILYGLQGNTTSDSTCTIWVNRSPQNPFVLPQPLSDFQGAILTEDVPGSDAATADNEAVNATPPERAPCTASVCTAGFTLKSNYATLRCETASCTTLDQSTCCDRFWVVSPSPAIHATSTLKAR